MAGLLAHPLVSDALQVRPSITATPLFTPT
jgi:hypothetical protein